MIKKKADSQMVSYVLLVVIAISLSVAVFAYLKLYLPSSKDKCSDDVNVVIENSICKAGRLNLTVSNRGLFNVSMIFVRFGNESKIVRSQINPGTELLNPPLSPGDIREYSFVLSSIPRPGIYIVETQPATLSEKRNPMLCRIVTQKVNCLI